jgi:flagellin-specific chaperone FliS
MISRQEIAERYSRTQLETAGHPWVIWMMHARCVHLIKSAQGAAPAEKVYKKNLLIHAQNLLAELEGAIKVTDELSKSIFYLYDYCYCLIESDAPENLALAHKTLSLLRDAFAALLHKRV